MMKSQSQMQSIDSEQKNKILLQMQNDPDLIKKSKIHYINCNCKGLHEGQKLVLVCLDIQCKNKGLICPVCKEENHKDHEVIHLKIFLSELHNKIIHRTQANNSNLQQIDDQFGPVKTLSEHLNTLQIARKSIVLNLQQSVRTIAQAVKEIEKQIHQQYLRIRRIILSQKSFESRLPKIYQILLTPSIGDEKISEQIKSQIKKLTQLLEKNPKKGICSIKIDQIKVASNAEKIVEMYVQNSQTCTTHLLSLITDLPKKIADLPIKMKNIIEDQSKNKIKYQFSKNLKAASVLLSQNSKEISLLGPEQIGGLAFIQTQFESETEIRKVNLKITGSVSDSISLGIGDLEHIKSINYVVSNMENEGLYGICAMGINITDIQSPTFVFSQGDIIEITFDPKNSKLTFRRRNGLQKQQIDLGISEQECKKLKFFVNLLLYGDSVQIVE